MRTATSLHRTYDADPDSVRAAREATVGFAAAAGFDAARLADVWLASSEALTNVVKHAYEVQGGKIELDVAITGNELCILIADEGRGLRPHPSGRGLGLGLMLIVAVSDEAAIWKRAGGGTAVSMRFGLEGSEPSGGRRQSRGSVCSATAPATSRFSTTT
ncbi:MAG TPA: ATP-binding protein [Solirubrobacteraceae bacterium]|nr:ATP-binding protein [Solirubrobacteraceae bacterium]